MTGRICKELLTRQAGCPGVAGPGFTFLLRPDLLIVVTVAGIASRTLLRRAASRWPPAILDPIPATARELGIGAEQEGLVKPHLCRVLAGPVFRLLARSGSRPVGVSPLR